MRGFFLYFCYADTFTSQLLSHFRARQEIADWQAVESAVCGSELMAILSICKDQSATLC
jgi:hypothetical protein